MYILHNNEICPENCTCSGNSRSCLYSYCILSLHSRFASSEIVLTREYQLPGYILCMLRHSTTWDRHWGGDGTLKRVLMYKAWLGFAQYHNPWILALSSLMAPKGSEGYPECIFFPINKDEATYINSIVCLWIFDFIWL